MIESSIYKFIGGDDYEFCNPLDGDDTYRLTDLVNGDRRKDTWKPFDMLLIREEEGKKLRPSDSPFLTSCELIFKPRAVRAMGPLLNECGELLPLRCKDANLVIYNVRRIDGLDEEASTISRYDDGRIMRIKRHVFREERVRGVDVFRLQRQRAGATYISQRFVDRWHSNELVGLDFVPVK